MSQGFPDRAINRRILEKTTRVADQDRIGQFRGAQTTDGFCHMQRSRCVDTHAAQGFTNASVVESQRPLAVQFEFDRHNHPALGLLLEDAVAVAKTAGRIRQSHDVQRLPIQGFDRAYELGHFSAVSTDVLDRRSANRARNQRHVLETVQTACHTPAHQVIPTLTRRHPDQSAVAIVLQHIDAG